MNICRFEMCKTLLSFKRKGEWPFSALLASVLCCLLLTSCFQKTTDSDSGRDSVIEQPPITEQEVDDIQNQFEVNNDIAMTVRSVADAINVGEKIDSTGYNFKGVLTDGSGMPLFTNLDGLPGEWEVEVVSPSVVQIRNLHAGDLVTEELVGYLSAALQLEADDTLELMSQRDSGDRKVAMFSFGKGTITIESESNKKSDEEGGEKILITMRADKDRVKSEPAAPSDSVDSKSPVVPESLPDNSPLPEGANSLQSTLK